MKQMKINPLLFLPLLALIFISCERPTGSPNFKVNHSISTPLIAEGRFVFLGESNAIIDTTSSEFDSLFSVNRQAGVDSGLVSLSQEQDISLGDLGGTVPTIQSDPQYVNSQLGVINGKGGQLTQAEVGTFSPEFSGSGQSSFEDIIGQQPQQGQPVPAGSNTIRIPLNMSNFESATIQDGAIQVEVANDLGIQITNIEIKLFSSADGDANTEDGNKRGTTISNTVNLNSGDTYTDAIQFSQGEQLALNLETEVFVEWSREDSYNGPDNPSFTVNVEDQNLVVSQATSDIPQQALNPTSPDIQIGDSQFEYAELTSDNPDQTLNRLNLQVTNNTTLPLTNSNSTGTPAITLRNSNGKVLDAKKSLQVENQTGASQIEEGETGTVQFDLSGERLTRNISYTLDLGTAGGNNLTVQSNDQVSIESSTSDLEVADARLEMDAEQIETSSAMSIDEGEFQFTKQDHYVKLEKGYLVIDSLMNQMGVDINQLDVKIKDIFTPEGDTLEISFTGSSDGPEGSYQYRRIKANETDERDPIRIDLSGSRIKALNNEIEYTLSGETENTGTEAVSISSSDEVGAQLQVTELTVSEARGLVTEKQIFLNEDDPSNGTDIIDLYNDQEAEVQEFDDLAELSERIGETRFFGTGFDLLYDVNLGVPARIYGVLVGINESGERVYLTPKGGSKFEVQNSDFIDGLQIEGKQVDPSRVLKLPIKTANQIGNTYHGAIRFNPENTNVDQFLSNFPTTIRFVGKAVTNPENEEGFVVTPINFNSSIGFEIPIELANSEGSQILQDTLEADLSTLPGPDSDQTLKRSAIRIKYTNMIPMEIDLQVKFLDERDSVVATAPVPGSGNQALLEAPQIDQQTRFATTPAEGQFVIDISDSQAEKLYKTRNIRLGGNFITPSGSQGSHRVKVRFDDYFQFKIIGDFKIQSSVGQ